MGLRVVWGRGEVIETFVPTSRFTRVDLPTFGRPTTATKPLLKPFWVSLFTDLPGRRRGGVSRRTENTRARPRPRARRPLRNRTRAGPAGRRPTGRRARRRGGRRRRAGAGA